MTEFKFDINKDKSLEENMQDYQKAYAGYLSKQSNETIDALKAENSKYKSEARERLIKKHAKDVDAERFEKLIKYTKVSEEDTEETISKKLKETHDDLFSNLKLNTKPQVKEVKEEKEEPETEYRFVK